MGEALNSFGVFDQICMESFGKDFFTCFEKVRRFSKDIGTLDKANQAKAMVGILAALSNDD